MEYNPFTKEYNQLKRVLEEKNSKKLNLSDEMSWFDGVDISRWHSTLENESSSKNKLQIIIIGIEKEIIELQVKIHETKKYIGTMFNPFNWFNDEQKAYRNKLDDFEKGLNVKQEINKHRKKASSDIEQSIKKINKDIEKYKNFNRQSVNNEINHISREIESLEKEFKKVSNLKNKVDIDLQVVLKQIKNYELEISNAKEDIRKARLLEKNWLLLATLMNGQ